MGRIPKLLALALLLAAEVGCGPSAGGGHGAHGLLGVHHGALPLMNRALRMSLRAARPRGFRHACEGNVARLCPDAHSRREERRCLEEKISSVSAECKTVLETRRNGHRQNFR